MLCAHSFCSPLRPVVPSLVRSLCAFGRPFASARNAHRGPFANCILPPRNAEQCDPRLVMALSRPGRGPEGALRAAGAAQYVAKPVLLSLEQPNNHTFIYLHQRLPLRIDYPLTINMDAAT